MKEQGSTCCGVLMVILSSLGALAVFTVSTVILTRSPEMECDPKRMYTLWEVVKLQPLFDYGNHGNPLTTMTRLEVEITPDSMQTRKLPKLLYFNNNPNAQVYFTWKFNADNGTVTSTIPTTTTTEPTTTTTDYIDIDAEPGTEYDSSEDSSLETDQSQYDEETEYDSDSEEYSSSNEDYGGKGDYDSGYRKKRDVPTEIKIVQEPKPKPCIINAKYYAAAAIVQAILQFVLPLVFWTVLSNTQHYGFADTLVIAMYILAVSMNLLGIHTFTRNAQPPFWDLWMYLRVILFLDVIVFLVFVIGCASAMDDIEDEEESKERKGKEVKKATV